MRSRSAPCRGALLALALLALSCGVPGRGRAQPAGEHAAPARHRIGLFVTGLYGFDMAGGTFGITFWLWVVGPEAGQVLRTLDFVNAAAIADRLASTVPTGQGERWGQARFSGTFREPWHLRRYPFDRHRLEILIEEGSETARRVAFEADTRNSGFNLQEAGLEGWRIRSLRVVPWANAYPTNFGDPSVAEPLSSYSAVRVLIDIERTHLFSGFFKLTGALYAAFLLCLIGCLAPQAVVGFGPRITLLGLALLAMVVNMRAASAALGSEQGLTLIDGLHLAGLAYVLALAGVSALLRSGADRALAGAAAPVRLDRGLCALAAAGFVTANAVLLLGAAA